MGNAYGLGSGYRNVLRVLNSERYGPTTDMGVSINVETRAMRRESVKKSEVEFLWFMGYIDGELKLTDMGRDFLERGEV